MSKDQRSGRRRNQPSPAKGFRLTGPLIGVAAAIVLVVGVALLQNSLHSSDVAAVSATPTPNPSASIAGAIQLVDGKAIGEAVFPNGDTATGGKGDPIDDIQCAPMEFATLHVHSHLAVFVHGKQIQIPQQIGIVAQRACYYWVHTHDGSGIIHIEAPIFRGFTLGNFFDVWGEPLSANSVATFGGTVKAYVNGAFYDADPRTIPLRAHQQITLEIGPPYVPVPTYTFPEHE